MTEIVSESLIADQNAMLADRLAQDYEHLAGLRDYCTSWHEQIGGVS